MFSSNGSFRTLLLVRELFDFREHFELKYDRPDFDFGSVRFEDDSASVGGIVRDQTDSLEVATAIQEGLIGGSNSTLIRRILQRFSQFQHWRICHIPREENHEDDRLVKLAYLDSERLQNFE
ncbi:hypothetical protein Gotri_013937, partial [Gossypium trilobum]|nr:hypothetical protein [Gossypium trilobum]